MTRSIPPHQLLDHAGAYYPWFARVTPSRGQVTITTDPEVTGEPAQIAVLTSAQLGAAVERALLATPDHDTYELAFYRDLLAGRFDDADGDQNAVDLVLQLATFGDVIFN